MFLDLNTTLDMNEPEMFHNVSEIKKDTTVTLTYGKIRLLSHTETSKSNDLDSIGRIWVIFHLSRTISASLTLRARIRSVLAARLAVWLSIRSRACKRELFLSLRRLSSSKNRL